MNNNICQTCLSEDRQLTPLMKLHYSLQELNIYETNIYGGVCWECHKLITKFTKFKLQVRQAQELLKFKIKNKKSFSNLAIDNKNQYDFNFWYTPDPLTDNDEFKINALKEENTFETDWYTEHNLDQKLSAQDNVNINIEYTKLKSDIDLNHCTILDEKNNEFKINQQLTGNIEIENTQIVKDNIVCSVRQKKYLKTNRNKLNEDELKDKFLVKVFTVEEMLKNREEKRNQPNFKKIPFKCDSCVLGFTRVENHDIHVKKKHCMQIGRYICDVCEIRFPNKKPLERHCRKHFTCYQCRLCKYETVELWSAFNHCRSKHSADELNKIHCKQCTLVFKTPEDLTDHVITEHTLLCNECGEKFKGKNTLRSHKLRIHGVKREFVCEICNKSFKTKSRMESHASTHSASIAQKLAYCSLCQIQYKNIHVYRNHLRNSAAHSHDAYSCPECNKKFVSKVYWTQHYNFYHLKQSQFKCETCNKLFISDWRLKNHRQKHHGLSRSRDHSCDVCGKKFFTVSTLRAHQLTHSEHRSYMCEDCGDTFKQRPALYTHSRLVHRGASRKK